MQLYHPENIYIVLVGVEVWTSKNRINVNASDEDATLDEFCAYRQNNISPNHNNDNAQLISYVATFWGRRGGTAQTSPKRGRPAIARGR